MPLADRQHEIHLVHPESEAPLGALQIGDQRRDGEPGQRQCMAHHRFGIGELRQELRRDERADLDLAHAGGEFGVQPGDLLLGRHDFGEALEAVAQPDLADIGTLAHSSLRAIRCWRKAKPGAPPGQSLRMLPGGQPVDFFHVLCAQSPGRGRAFASTCSGFVAPAITLATAGRCDSQLRRAPETVAALGRKASRRSTRDQFSSVRLRSAARVMWRAGCRQGAAHRAGIYRSAARPPAAKRDQPQPVGFQHRHHSRSRSRASRL